MFEKLVVSSSQRRGHRTARYFATTSLVYLFTSAAALALSVYWSSPKLADASPRLRVDHWIQPGGGQERTKAPKTPPKTDPAPSYQKVKQLDDIIKGIRDDQRRVIPVSTPLNLQDGASIPGGGGGSNFPGIGVGPGGPGTGDHFEKGDAPKPEPPAPVATQVEPQRPVRLTSFVLQGKAIKKVTPSYPIIAKNIRLQGDVAVEVIISPQGNVEAARVVSGHPLLAQAAKDAAIGWRFEPTLLRNTPVRVTGVITFVFRMGE